MHSVKFGLNFLQKRLTRAVKRYKVKDRKKGNFNVV